MTTTATSHRILNRTVRWCLLVFVLLWAIGTVDGFSHRQGRTDGVRSVSHCLGVPLPSVSLSPGYRYHVECSYDQTAKAWFWEPIAQKDH